MSQTTRESELQKQLRVQLTETKILVGRCETLEAGLIELARELAQARERCAGLERLLDERAGDYRAHEAARLGNPLLPVMETALAGL